MERAISVLAGVVTALVGAFFGGIVAVTFPLLMDIQQREVLFIVGALVGAVPGVLVAVKGFQGRPL